MDSREMRSVPSPEGLRSEIEAFVAEWKRKRGKDYWRRPLAGVASEEDPLFAQLKSVVDPSHALPSDLLPGVRSVVVFFLPFHKALGDANDREQPLACREWAESYVETNLLIRKVGGHLGRCLRKAGYAALTTPATHEFDEEELVSRWSHKHVGYIAGLGTFGRNHLLITEGGCCGRLGSLLTSAQIPATPRPLEERCLEKAGKACLACMSKCRYRALLEDSFDRQACYRQYLENDAYYSDLPLVDVCGKCSCAVPCSYEIPAR